MRDISVYPITVEEVRSALDTAASEASHDTGPDFACGSIDGLALHYLGTFLESPSVQSDLRRKLEELQPKRTDESLENLDKKTLEKLAEKAHAIRNRNVFTFEYRGISKRGSYVYDLNTTYASQARLYVRIHEGKLQGEGDEDDFNRVIQQPKLVIPQPSMDTPVSATWHWFKIFKDWFNAPTKSKGPQ